MRHSIRDKNGRFVKKKNIRTSSVSLPGIDNSLVIPSQPNMINEAGGLWGGKPLDTSNNGATTHKPNRFFFALFWATIGFLAGVIFEMFVQLVTK